MERLIRTSQVRTGEGGHHPVQLQPLILGHTDKAHPASRLQVQVSSDDILGPNRTDAKVGRVARPRGLAQLRCVTTG